MGESLLIKTDNFFATINMRVQSDRLNVYGRAYFSFFSLPAKIKEVVCQPCMCEAHIFLTVPSPDFFLPDELWHKRSGGVHPYYDYYLNDLVCGELFLDQVEQKLNRLQQVWGYVSGGLRHGVIL